jgi:DNA-binding transcriptional regulator YiaG
MLDTLPQATARDLARPLALLLPQDIRDMRRLCALTMRGLARRLGVSVETVSRWERGDELPTRANTYKLLDCFMQAQAEAGALRARARRLRQRDMVDVGEAITDAT